MIFGQREFHHDKVAADEHTTGADEDSGSRRRCGRAEGEGDELVLFDHRHHWDRNGLVDSADRIRRFKRLRAKAEHTRPAAVGVVRAKAGCGLKRADSSNVLRAALRMIRMVLLNRMTANVYASGGRKSNPHPGVSSSGAGGDGFERALIL
ncbi:MAG: hypothetical protein WC429_23990 [Verrucomicrobiia bacterium]|jgi:hypothetical protein